MRMVLLGASLVLLSAAAWAVPFVGTYDVNVHASPGILDMTRADTALGEGWFGLDKSWTAIKGVLTLRGATNVPGGPIALGLLGCGLLLVAWLRRRATRSTSNRP